MTLTVGVSRRDWPARRTNFGLSGSKEMARIVQAALDRFFFEDEGPSTKHAAEHLNRSFRRLPMLVIRKAIDYDLL